jgi:hypothetical protein
MTTRSFDDKTIKKFQRRELFWLTMAVLNPLVAVRQSAAKLQTYLDEADRKRLVFQHWPGAATDMSASFRENKNDYLIKASTGFFLLLFYIVEIHAAGVDQARAGRPTPEWAEEHVSILRSTIIDYVDSRRVLLSIKLLRRFWWRRRHEAHLPAIPVNLSFYFRAMIDFVVAHELGHVVLEHLTAKESEGAEWERKQELAADAFAAKLLVGIKQKEVEQVTLPAGWSRAQHKSLISQLTLDAIALLFGAYYLIECATEARDKAFAHNYPPAKERYLQFKRACYRAGVEKRLFDTPLSSGSHRAPDRIHTFYCTLADAIDWT